MDNTELFNGRADAYTKGRPAYPDELIERLKVWAGISPTSTIADIGAGTGIFTAQLAACGARILAVEPNADMRAQAESHLAGLANVSLLDGTAENTGIEPASVDLVTAAQAFHWFDGEAFRAECLRISRGPARVALVWNRRIADAPINIETERLFRTLCPRFKGFSGGVAENDELIVAFFRGEFETWRLFNDLVYDRERFITRSLSGSYAPKPGEAAYGAFLEGVEDIFERFQTDGTVIVPNETRAHVGTLR